MDKEKGDLERQLETGNKGLEDQLKAEEEKRKREAEAAKEMMENDKKLHGNEITQMFDRLKGENEQVGTYYTID